jgi:hypothetical protein
MYGEQRNSYRALVGNPKERRPPTRPKRRKQDIKTDLKLDMRVGLGFIWLRMRQVQGIH